MRGLEDIIYRHYSAGGSTLDTWHNELHDSLAKTIESLKQPVLSPGEVKKFRIAACNDIDQLKIGADLIDGSGDTHWLELVTELNKVLPEDQRIYIPPPTNIPQA